MGKRVKRATTKKKRTNSKVASSLKRDRTVNQTRTRGVGEQVLEVFHLQHLHSVFMSPNITSFVNIQSFVQLQHGRLRRMPRSLIMSEGRKEK